MAESPLYIQSKDKEKTDYAISAGHVSKSEDPIVEYMSGTQLDKAIARVRRLMSDASSRMDFLEAAQYRDEMFKLESLRKEKDNQDKQ